MLSLGLGLTACRPLSRIVELLANSGGPFTTTANVSTIGVTKTLSNGALVLTAQDGNADRGEWALSGLDVGQSYLFEIEAEATGPSAFFYSFTWGSVEETPITTRQTYSQEIVATATSGVCRIYAASSGSAGDTVSVYRISVKRA